MRRPPEGTAQTHRTDRHQGLGPAEPDPTDAVRLLRSTFHGLVAPEKDPDREPRPRRRATYTRPHGVRHLFATYDLVKDQLYGHIKKTKNRSKFLEFCRYLRSLHPLEVRIAIVCDSYSPHLSTKRCQRVATWAAANNVEIAHTPANSSWLNRIEAQGSMIRRYIIWRNKHATDQRLREIVNRANVA